jgi:tetratricopeptide (TPR) repeat protein
MIRRANGWKRWRLVCASVVALTALATLALATAAAAQTTGMVKGTVKDDKGQPVEGAKITIEFSEGVNRRQETKTNKKGEFVQIGLQSGTYKVTAEKEGVGSQSLDARVRIGAAAELNFVLAAGKAGATKEDMAKVAELRKTFEEGVTASKSGNMDEAIAKFTRGTEISPTCADCYYNMGYAYSQKKDYEKAEAAYKKAIEIKAQYAEAYNGLANVYNAQRKFEEAAAASAKASELGGAGGGAAAGGGGNANALYNQGVILWNAGKIPDAKKQFEAAISADPNHAESHYQLGMALVNEGNLTGSVTEFETYLKLAPEGPNAATAKSLIAQLKK